MDETFPVSDYYRPHVVEGTTISKRGAWWSAVLLIRDPNSGKRFVKLYRWQRSGDEWKTRTSYKIAKIAQLRDTLSALETYADRVVASESRAERGPVSGNRPRPSKASVEPESNDPSANAGRPAIRIRLASKKR